MGIVPMGNVPLVFHYVCLVASVSAADFWSMIVEPIDNISMADGRLVLAMPNLLLLGTDTTLSLVGSFYHYNL